MHQTLSNKSVLVTGGAGFIGSNLCEYLLEQGNTVTCLDNFATGHYLNLKSFIDHPRFRLVVGDIRNPADCMKACENVEIVFHQAALGSVPRSLNDPATTNGVNISGFLNMLLAARDNEAERFIYAASSSTYGDSASLPKTEDIIGKPLSPYAVTKYVNELYAHVFGLNYGLKTIGLRYFNVYGRRQDPHGAYAAVIPLFVKKLMSLESPVINGDGTNSRDFTYIDNVLQMNHLAAITHNPEAFGQVFNTAVGERNNLLQLVTLLKTFLSRHDPRIANVEILHGPERPGDIPHSHASVDKAARILGYAPSHTLAQGLEEAVEWYWNNLS